MFGRKWSTLSPAMAFAIIGLVAAIAALTPQVVAVAVTARHRLQADDRLSIFEVLGLWGQLDPTRVTGAPVPAQLHWGLVALTSTMLVTGVVLVMIMQQRMKKNPWRKKGLAPARRVAEQLGTRQLLKERGPKLRATIPAHHLQPTDVGYFLGRFWNESLWLRVEDPTIVIGPSRAGKGWYLVLNWIISAPGAVVTTSSKLDNALLTMMHRIRRGSRAWIFAPGIAGGESLGHVLRWDPVAGCVDEETLVRRMHALIPGDSFSGSTSNGGHWDTLGQQLASHLFHAAACMGADVDKVWEWVSSPQRALEAVKAIREHPHGLLEHAKHLETVINMPAEQRASQWGVLPTVLAFLGSGMSRKWMKPAPGEAIDLVDFVLNKGTLYLVGDKQSTGGYKRIIDGLLAEIDYVTKGIADASVGARVDPPVSYVLDEAGNFEYSGLYELITAGGGRGRIALVVFQSREQLQQWGAENAKTLWDAATAKIVLPGGANEEELRSLSNLIGELWIERLSHSFGGGSGSTSVSEERRAILEPVEIREMEIGYGLLFYRNLKPVIMKMTPFHKHAHYAGCEKDSLALSEQMRIASPFAAQIDSVLQVRVQELEEAKRTYA